MTTVGIDASNIKAGGGLTHLLELIINHPAHSTNKLVLFGSKALLEAIPEFPYLIKQSHSWLDKRILFNTLWRIFILRSAAKKHGINIMFTPGGNFLFFRPYISMSQNMLVFETAERNRFPLKERLRYIILEMKQLLSFRFASGIIYISEYAKSYIQHKYPFLRAKASAVIYHGVSDRFNTHHNFQGKTVFETTELTFRILYVSIINYYKHQDKLIEGILRLKKSGVPVELHLIGPMNPTLKKTFNALLSQAANCVVYHGQIPYQDIHTYYDKCDLFVFASTCENMPNILVEAMKASVPILCSKYGPMPEILKDAGIYFDPTNVDDFCDKVLLYKNSPSLRQTVARKAATLAASYTWPLCSEKTFDFITSCLKNN